MRPEQLYRTWSAEEMEHLKAALLFGKSDAQIGAELGRSANAVTIRRRRFLPGPPRDESVSPGWQGGKVAGGKYWTRERIVAALVDFAAKHKGPLPTSDHVYNRLKKGHMEWPTAQAVLDLWPSMPDAWDAIGMPRSRVRRTWAPWTPEEDDYLLERAGNQTLKIIAKQLGRSWQACKRRLYDLGAGRARDVSGYMSAMQVAKEFNCPLSRVKKLIATGELKAHRVKGGHYWRVDPSDAEAIAETLRAPKRRSYKNRPPSIGDYERRYGLRRVSINGRIVRVAV